jgi:hypothetical protein
MTSRAVGPKWILNASRAFVKPRVRVDCGTAFWIAEVDEFAGGTGSKHKTVNFVDDLAG